MTASWLDDAVSQFGRNMGLPSLASDASGVVQLELQAGGVLAIEAAQGGAGTDVLVCLGRPLGFSGGRAVRKALESVHCASGHMLDIRVAVRGEGPQALLFGIVNVPQREFTAHTLERVVDYLRRWIEEARHG